MKKAFKDLQVGDKVYMYNNWFQQANVFTVGEITTVDDETSKYLLLEDDKWHYCRLEINVNKTMSECVKQIGDNIYVNREDALEEAQKHIDKVLNILNS